MLSEFYLSVHDFRSRLKACQDGLAKWPRINRIQLHRMSDLGQDLISFSESLVRAQINATMWLLDETFEMQRAVPPNPPDWSDLWAFHSGERQLTPPAEQAVRAHIEDGKRRVERMVRLHKSGAGKRSEESAWELKAVYKAYFFFIRAFHDACYGVVLNLSNQSPGAYSSMNRCITKKASRVFEQIETIPGYVNWFIAFKQKRDLIKSGVDFFSMWPTGRCWCWIQQKHARGRSRCEY
jgi:hypothetical protein